MSYLILRSPRVVVAKLLGWDIIVSEFEVHFRKNTLGKSMNPLSFSYGLNIIPDVLLQGLF